MTSEKMVPRKFQLPLKFGCNLRTKIKVSKEHRDFCAACFESNLLNSNVILALVLQMKKKFQASNCDMVYLGLNKKQKHLPPMP